MFEHSLSQGFLMSDIVIVFSCRLLSVSLFCVMIKCQNVLFPELVISSILAAPALDVTQRVNFVLGRQRLDSTLSLNAQCLKLKEIYSNRGWPTIQHHA